MGSVFGTLLAGITPFVPGQAFAMALIACVAGSLGHMVMKALKRDRGIPIWHGQGPAVTGAGGLLDRVDALCFAAPSSFTQLDGILASSPREYFASSYLINSK